MLLAPSHSSVVQGAPQEPLARRAQGLVPGSAPGALDRQHETSQADRSETKQLDDFTPWPAHGTTLPWVVAPRRLSTGLGQPGKTGSLTSVATLTQLTFCRE